MQLIEREEQLAALAAAYEAASAGAGRLVFVAGEAGAGKTALVRAFAARPPARVLLAGVCDPLETPRPLGPLLDMAPGLARRAGRPLPDSASREDLLAFIADALGAADDPPVLVLEDVHWADQATIDLLRYAGRRLERVHALVLATLREDETPAGSPVALLLGDLATAAGVSRLAVPPLSPEGTARMVAGSGLDAARIHQRTGGNPFFIGEVVRSGADGVPPTVRDAVLVRFARLPDPARRALEAAAALGARVEPELLLRVVERRGVPRWGVEEAVTAGFLVWQDRDLAFRHELARAAIAGATGAAERQRLHEVILADLRRRPARDGDHDELLRHAEAAGDDACVREVAPLAAARAGALHAHREAAALLQKAIERSHGLPAEHLADLLERQAGELYQSGQLGAAMAGHQRAADLRAAAGDPRRQAWNLSHVSRLGFLCGRRAESRAAHLRAVEILRTFPPGSELARAHEASARVRFMEQDLVGAAEEADLALSIATAAGDGPLSLDARVTAGVARLQLGDPAARDELEAALAEARERGLDDAIVRTTLYLGWIPIVVRSYAGVERRLAEGIAMAVDRELPYWDELLASAAVRSALDQGRWAEVEPRARGVLDRRDPTSIASAQALVSWGRLQARRGQPEAQATLDAALAVATADERVEPIIRAWPARAEAAWLTGDPSAVHDVVREALARRPDVEDPWWHGELAFWAGAPETRVPAAPPYALSLGGDWAAAAAWWRERGCAYEAAMAVALARRPGAGPLREALESLDRLGARPAADHVRRRLREIGVTGVPRGPRASTLGTPGGLTRRERDVLLLVAAGMSNAEIAGRLFLSPKTVERHLSGIFRKLGAATRVEAVAMAARIGLLSAN